MLIIIGRIKVDSEAELARVKDALVRRAAKSRADAGNVEYTFSQNLEDPTEIRLIEKWENEETLNAHLQVPDDEFNGILRTAKIETAVVTSYEVSGEQELLNR